jgi:hypothetical protein
MIKYSPRAAKALGYLKNAYNDVEIYVEDQTCHHMYLLLFRKILPESVRLRSVNQLGNRKAVVEACKRDQDDDGRKRLYIIDGDFDYYHHRSRLRLKHLYRLRAYCVENILIHESAAIAVAAHADTNTAEDVVATRLDFRQWISETTRQLRSLFVIYATAEALSAGVVTVSFAVQRLVQGGRLSASKIRQRMLEVARGVCRKIGLRAYRNQRRAIQKNLAAIQIAAEHLISGKDYLLPLLHRRLRQMFHYHGSLDQLRTHLAENYDPHVETWLRRRLLNVVAAA